jgi:hypothetical protein
MRGSDAVTTSVAVVFWGVLSLVALTANWLFVAILRSWDGPPVD